jgi:transcriptional regulator with XRE-family HTH domain
LDYGRALRTARVARGLTQKELAQLAKVDPSYVSLVEAGNRTPSATNLEKFAEALGIPLYLMILLGSQKSDLRGLPEKDAANLGLSMLNMLVSITSKPKET